MKNRMKKFETRVIVIGGGATGTGILRDLSLRGIRCVLVEKDDLASGTTGRNHGLLHSGARYAVKDIISAKECIAENMILKKIARHCVENTGGLFVELPNDDNTYFEKLVTGCRDAGIDCNEIPLNRAMEIEPNLNAEVKRVLKVPDATIDPFRLASANTLDSMEHGAVVLTHTEVVSMIMDQGIVKGIRCFDRLGQEDIEIYGEFVVNAAGIWGQRICNKAGIQFPMHPSKGSMVIIDYRVNNVVVNRCRVPADGDIIVPGDTVSLIGTTSKMIPLEKIDEVTTDDDDIDVLLNGGEALIPNISKTRVLRVFGGVRPLVADTGDTRGRDISRGIVLTDHEERDGLKGFATITGGKLMTYRLMAEKTTDLVCEKLGINRKCETHIIPLPGSERETLSDKQTYKSIPETVVGSTRFRHGERAYRILKGDRKNYSLSCECEMVTSGEIEYAIENLQVKDLVDLRRRTRLGMGPCQGTLCAYRAAGIFFETGAADYENAAKMLIDFMEERWKGIRPVLWGDTLREAEFSYWIYQGLFGLGNLVKETKGRGEGVVVEEEY